MTLRPLIAVLLLLLAAPAAAQEVSPPARVGRIAWTTGQASFRPAGGTAWDQAVRNYPLSTGDALWTPAGAEAGVQVSDTTIDLAGGTEFAVDRLGVTRMAATLAQGEVVLHVRTLNPGETYQLVTPRGTVTIATPGRYEIAAGGTTAPSLVNVYQGAAELSGPASLTLRAGQSAVITGTSRFAVRVTPALHDRFAEQMLPAGRAAAPPPALVAAMPGGDDLGQYGQWSAVPAYGPVWYPRVGPGWVPYRDGHWAYIAPWGWTWIDDDPWGFAPFHYGRWARIGPRWAWVPGAVVVAVGPPVPVYAPALVTFFTVGGGGFAAGFTAGALLGGQVGWVPLAPFEVYHPCFRASPRWVREANERDVRNVVNITNVTENRITINRFGNRAAATMVPAAAMVASRPVAGLARPVPARLLAAGRPVLGRAPVPPAAGTLGVTRAVARQQGLRPLPAAVARQLPPALRPVPPRPMPHPAPRPMIAGRPALAPIGPAPRVGGPARTIPPGVAPRPGVPRVITPTGPARPGLPPRPGLPSRLGPAPAAHPPAPRFAAPPPLRGPGAAPRGVTPGRPMPPPPRVLTPARPQPRGVAPRVGSSGPGARALAPGSQPPPAAYRPPQPAYHPSQPAYRPPPPTYHPPAPAYRPPPQEYHPPAPAYRPPPQVYHPPAPAYRPPPQVYHPPAPVYRPPPPRQAPPPQERRKPQ